MGSFHAEPRVLAPGRRARTRIPKLLTVNVASKARVERQP
jgi:hypothetical protein